jgi:hypothetical protein
VAHVLDYYILKLTSPFTELDILNLIRIQGNTLMLEIFRRQGTATRQDSTKSKVFSPKLVPTVAARMSYSNQADVSTDEENSIKPTNIAVVKISSSNVAASNVSLENTKRRLRLPQVVGATPSKEVRI